MSMTHHDRLPPTRGSTGLSRPLKTALLMFAIVGAYGHSRLREWGLGGVTKNLPLSKDRYSLVLH